MRRALLFVLVVVGCKHHPLSDHDYCEQRQSAYERAYPDDKSEIGDHAKLVEMCEHGIATEHNSSVHDGKDMFERRMACSTHLGDEPALRVWEDMKDCESKTLF